MPENKIETLTDEQLISVHQSIPGDLGTRAQTAAVMGSQYGGDRNIYEALGYPSEMELNFNRYYAKYQRQDMARAIIDKPVNATWRGNLKIKESGEREKNGPTKFEESFKDLDKKLNLKSWFSRLDKLTGLGHFGILLLGFDDAKKEEQLARPVSGGNRKLLYVKAFAENIVEIVEWEGDPSNPRYSMPTLYKITVTDPINNTERFITVHHTRLLHVIDGALQNDTYGEPRLKPVFNRLMDLEKVAGGDAEMFWRGARPGIAGKEKEGYELTPDQREKMQQEIHEYEHNLRRFLVTKGMELQPLEQQVADPSGHVDVLVLLISAVTGIPKRILVGSERGELASSEDRTQWLSEIKTRREEFAESKVIRPFIEICMRNGVLPKPETGDYLVAWEDLFAPSNREKAEVGQIRAEAIYYFTRNPMAVEMMSKRNVYKLLLGLPDDQIDEMMQDEDQDLEDELRRIREQQEGNSE